MNKTILLAALVVSTGLPVLPAFAQDATAGASAKTTTSVDANPLVKGATQTTGRATGALGGTLQETGHTLRPRARKATYKAAAIGDSTGDIDLPTRIKANANPTGVKLDTKADTNPTGVKLDTKADANPAGVKLDAKADAQVGGTAGH